MNRPRLHCRILLFAGAVLIDACRSPQPPPERMSISTPIAAATLEAESSSIENAEYEADIVGPDGLLGTLTIAIVEGAQEPVRKRFEELVRQPLVVTDYQSGVKLVIGKEGRKVSASPNNPSANLEQGSQRGTISISPRSEVLTVWIGYNQSSNHGEQPIAQIRSGIEHLDSIEQLVRRDGTLTVPIEIRFRRR